MEKGLAVFDLDLRLSAIVAVFASTSIMGKTDQTLPFFTQFFQFHAEFNDVLALMFFVIANAIASGYLRSLRASLYSLHRPALCSRGKTTPYHLFKNDFVKNNAWMQVVMGLTTSAASASASAAFVY